MNLEIEIKLKVEALAPIRARLAECGGELASHVLETNHIFDRADRSLLHADQGLRVRAVSSRETSQRPSATLTFKGPRQAGDVKTRPELEVTIGDARTTCAILEALGYECVVRFEKRRETWRLDTCRVELDELPNLGSFVEIEGPSQDAVERARTTLGLAAVKVEPSTYIALLIDDAHKHGRSPREIRFAEPAP